MSNNSKLTNNRLEGRLGPAIVARVTFESFPSQVVFLDEYCIEPECECRDVTLVFFEIEDNKTNDELFSLKFNVDTWKLITQQIHKKDIDCDGMINEFLMGFDDKTKFIIKGRFESGKKFGGDNLKMNIDYSTLQKGKCQFYNEIFFSKEYDRFLFEYKGNTYYVLDQYCTNPKCNCNDVVLVFNTLKAQRDSCKFKFAMRLRFKTGKYSVEDKIDNLTDEELEDNFKYFIESLNDPELKLFKERYSRMKRITSLLKQPSYEIEHTEPNNNHLNSTKVSRNEPCPCGSGKKYKKCCGS